MSTHDYQKPSHKTYDNFPNTPVHDLANQSPNCDVAVEDYLEYHKLNYGLLPLPGRAHEPIELARELQESLDDLHDCAESFMLKDIHGCAIPNKHVYNLYPLYKVTPMQQTSKGMRYCNPQYIHYDKRIEPVTDDDERLTMYHRYKVNPAIGGEWFAKHWGMQSRKGVSKWLRRRDISLREDNRKARRRIAHTLVCIQEWRDMPLKTQATVLPWDFTNIRDWASKHVTQSDWQCPRDISNAAWFRESGSY